MEQIAVGAETGRAYVRSASLTVAFHQGRIRLIINPDGTESRLAGGYRDWRNLYAQNVFACSMQRPAATTVSRPPIA